MRKSNYIIAGLLGVGAIVLCILAILPQKSTGNTHNAVNTASTSLAQSTVGLPIEMATTSSPDTVLPESGTLPAARTLDTSYHIFQTFNNCAPAALSMALSYFGVNASQETLAADLRPYNNLQGLNDDKSTPPDELAAEAEKYGLIAYFRPAGDIDTLKQFIAQGIPVVIRTLLDTDHDYAHYRIVKGYDNAQQEIIQDDSFQGKNKRYSYDALLTIWKPFNYGYLVLGRPSQKEAIEKIIGGDLDENVAWHKALDRAWSDLAKNPEDVEAGFNRSVAEYYLGNYQESVSSFEKVESRLEMRVLWYQLQPIAAYFALGMYDRVFSLTDRIFNDNNKAYTELYILRGKSYEKLGRNDLAKAEFEKAVLYNVNSKDARDALAGVGTTH